jgi:hypothetical protein
MAPDPPLLYRCATFTRICSVARKSGPLDVLVHNIVVRTAVYYVALFLTAAWLYRLPQAQALVQASLDALINSPVFGFGKSDVANAAPSPVSSSTLSLTAGASMIGAVLLALPVAWIYTLTRKKRGYDQSVVHTLILLPALVAGVVVLVKYSLALAFSLAGIVAAVRFRNNLEDSKDAVYIFLATAIGLAAGVQLPLAAVISVVFNLIVLALWFTEFGKVPPALEGAVAERRLEEARDRLRSTGSFVAMLDDEIFADMTPDQLDLTADRAWRRRRRLDSTEDMSDEEMQKRDALLRIRTNDVDEMRAPVEAVLGEFCKKFRFGGVIKEPDGSRTVEYAIQLKKTARGVDLADALHAKSQVIDAEIK